MGRISRKTWAVEWNGPYNMDPHGELHGIAHDIPWDKGFSTEKIYVYIYIYICMYAHIENVDITSKTRNRALKIGIWRGFEQEFGDQSTNMVTLAY